jgi:hypothetical protein
MSKRVKFAVLLLTLGVIGHCAAAQPMIEFTIGGKTQSFSQGVLLGRPDAADIRIPRDVAYGTSTTYRAVPLADLVDAAALPADSVLEARATDGFAAQLPMDLVRNRDPATAVAWLAVEDPAQPWPKLPGKPVSAGPFYLVWVGREAESVSNRSDPRGAKPVHYSVSRLSSAQPCGQRGHRPRPQCADESSRVLPARGIAPLYSQSGIGSRLAGPDHARVPPGPTERSRDRSDRRLSGVHGAAEGWTVRDTS